MLTKSLIKVIYNPEPPFNKGDIIDCYDEMLGRTITGYIINVVRATDGIYDLIIRWNDLFVVIEKCSVPEAKKRIKMKLWRFRPTLDYKVR